MNIRLAIFALLTALSVDRAGAMPVEPSLQDAPPQPNIAIDPKPDEWRGLAGYGNPFVRLIKTGDESKMTAMLADPILVNFKPCYALQARTAPAKSPVVSVPYKMPADGEVTLGLYDKDG